MTGARLFFGRALAFVATAALIAGCGGGAAYRYRTMAERYGLHRALHHAFVRDGENVEMHVSDLQGRPIAGLVFVIDDAGKPMRIVSDTAGRIAFPVSSRLLETNPVIDVQRPRGVGRFSMTFVAKLVHACHFGKRPELTPAPRDFESWPVRDFDLARVYVQDGVATESVEKVGRILAQARSIFLDLTGAPPPAIGVALSKAQHLASTGMQDPAGATIWPVSESELADDHAMLTVVHEWTHAVMATVLTGARDERSRYLEDGLCEVVSHLTYERFRSTRGSSVAAGRADELVASEKRSSFDLAKLSMQYGPANGLTLFDQLASACDDPQVVIGYGLGMAFWLQQMDRDPAILQRLFQRLRQTKQPGAQAFIDASDELSQPRGAMRSVDVDHAIEILRAHSPN